MDIVAFSKSIDNDPVSLVKDYFDELMAMYDLFGSYDGISITSSITDDQPISFWITFDSKTSAEEMSKIATDREIMICGKIYKISGKVKNNSVVITIE